MSEMGIRLSPVQVRMLMHAYANPSPWPTPSQAYADFVALASSAGVLTVKREQESGEEVMVLLPRGLAWVEMILNTPPPEPAFIDPRDPKIVYRGNRA
jgi:hypothetical protein